MRLFRVGPFEGKGRLVGEEPVQAGAEAPQEVHIRLERERAGHRGPLALESIWLYNVTKYMLAEIYMLC